MRAAKVQGQRLVYLSERDGVDWIVSHGDGQTTDLMPVNEIPATFGGAARHNVMNAMQAISAALELGIEWPAVRSAMATFSMSIEATPGRLNLHPGPGFPVLLDFVQNLDAMRTLCEFADRMPVSGKRILVASVLGRHDNETVRSFARYAAASFDRFICRNYGKTFEHRSKDEIPKLLRDGLMREGVPESSITIVLDEKPAIDAALKMGRPGDLVVIMCGIKPRENWQQISEHGH
jgi:cyanophycin synthetase